jgi:hypothetical protein
MRALGFPEANPKNQIAVTTVDSIAIKIYAYPRSRMCDADGVTLSDEADVGIDVYVCREYVKDKKRLKALLTHEFIHVIEILFRREFSKPNPPDCTNAATIFGERLPEMFDNLRYTSSRARRNGSRARSGRKT